MLNKASCKLLYDKIAQLTKLIATASHCILVNFSLRMINANTVVRIGHTRYANDAALTLIWFITNMNRPQFAVSNNELPAMSIHCMRCSGLGSALNALRVSVILFRLNAILIRTIKIIQVNTR